MSQLLPGTQTRHTEMNICTTNMSYWSFIACLCYIPLEVISETKCQFDQGTIHISKACYGSGGRPCAGHSISCNSPHQISICDAYYTNNRECGEGIPDCKDVNLDNVVQDGLRRIKFSVELDSLFNMCSTKPRCWYPAPRRSDARWPNQALTFSVVKYQCVDRLDDADGNGKIVGAAVGGVVASVLAVVIIVIVTVWYLRKRRHNKDEKSATHDPETQTKPHDLPQNHYQEIDDSRTRGRSNNYDYATADGMMASPSTHAYLTIEPVTGSIVQCNPANTSKEDDYDHIGDKPPVQSSNYDTTASVAQSLGTRGHSREDDYGYNRLQEAPCTKTVQNDYDTTTTAGKTAQLGRNGNKTQRSPYDTGGKIGDLSGDYAVAGPMR